MASRVRISVGDLSKTFRQGAREVPAVSAVSLDVHEREFVAIVGPSGCGKSTVLNMIGGLIAPSAGEILVDGQPVLGAPPATVGYVFQKDTVFPWRTVERNIALGLEYRNVPAAERAARVREAIALA
ncbi:MAG TPA: ATP-binding cassette domain-containing protein, partial [Methylomirabilota bacterium]